MTTECTCTIEIFSYRIAYCPLHAAAPALLAVLEAVEWVFYGDYEGVTEHTCPSCLNFRYKAGHDPDCQLDAALKAARNKEE